jgi:excisionase family DNA binding protein
MDALTLKEVAAELRVSYTQAKRLVLVHGLPYVRVGLRRIIVRWADLEAWVENRVVNAGK